MKIKTQEIKRLTRSEMKNVMGGTTIDAECQSRCFDQNIHNQYNQNWTDQNGSVIGYCTQICTVVEQPY
ncbi:hypothetical protein [Pedobacter frigidisoli]|uniref:hypothetical protein n=1 Tax=Pedobacter frigidisoli TaxID=2530455 RepID=UPI00292D8E25|nr:hypothetical protein [Pedobacter frigidisoli]